MPTLSGRRCFSLPRRLSPKQSPLLVTTTTRRGGAVFGAQADKYVAPAPKSGVGWLVAKPGLLLHHNQFPVRQLRQPPIKVVTSSTERFGRFDAELKIVSEGLIPRQMVSSVLFDELTQAWL